MALLMALTLSVSLFQVAALADEPAGRNLGLSSLTDFSLTVSQDGSAVADSGTIDSGKPLNVRCKFSLPLTDAETGERAVATGDYVTVDFPSWLTFSQQQSVSMTASVNGASVAVGTVTFSGSEAKVVFDLSDPVFALDAEGGSDVLELSGAWFTASMKADASGSGECQQTVTILDKTYTFGVQHVVHYALEKTGSLTDDKSAIEWTVKASAMYSDETARTATAPLGGLTVTDDLSKLGAYVSGSLKADGTAVASDTDYVQNGVLSYPIPADSTASVLTLTFRTAFDTAAAYATGTASASNTAVLVKDGAEAAEDTAKVDYNPTWITKTVTQCDTSGKATTDTASPYYLWTITVNPDGLALKNASVTDVLPGTLTFVSASLTAGSTSAAITPDKNGVYSLGDLTAAATLTILTKVKNLYNDLPVKTVAAKNMTNTASFRWDGSGTFSAAAAPAADYGFSPISKTSAAYDAAKHTATWSVSADMKGLDYGSGLQILDLLINQSKGSTAFNVKNAVAAAGTAALPTDVAAALKKLSVNDNQYGQSYVADSFHADQSGLVCTVYTVTSGSYTADLLVVTGLDKTQSNTFTVESLLTDPAVYAGNKKTEVNVAALFNGSDKIQQAAASRSTGWMLAKDVLSTANGSALEAGKTDTKYATSAGSDSACFNYNTHAVYFRILVNAKGLDYSTENGTYTFTDTLPAGWTFGTIGEASFLLYEGTGDASRNSQAHISLKDQVSDPSGVCTAVTGTNSAGQSTMTFTFGELDKPYVVVVKGVMSDETFQSVFSKNGTATYRNIASTGNGTNTTQEPCDWEDYTVTSTVLTKDMTTPVDGAITWTVNYHAYGLDHTASDAQAAQITDTIPAGIELRTDAQGKVLLNGNLTLTALTLKDDGTYAEGTPVSDETLAGLVSYTGRVLTVKLPAGSDSYRLTYVTDVTGEAGDSLTNTVSLSTAKQEQDAVQKKYTIQAADAGAALKFGGSFTVTKYDTGSKLLSGAEFTLTNGSITRRGVTGAAGTFRFKAVPAGTYTLKETTAPTGYELNTHSYTVIVSADGGVSIDGIDTKSVSVADTRADSASLKLTKTVTGSAATDADRTTAFTFTVTLPGAAGASYAYVGSGVADGTMTAGDNTVTLASGQSITVTGLPNGGSYTVAEKSAAGFTTTVNGAAGASVTGTLAAESTTTAAFVNDKSTTGGSDTPDSPSNPTNPATPIPETPVPATDTPATDIPGSDTPLTDTPAATDIPDDSTPKAEAPKTGDELAAWAAASGASVAGLLWLALSGRKRKEQ